ncbi:MAG: twin-arginine translocase TatA/TatE family subunit [Micavibrio sp.]|nr:twin-arginine translocase TatA/TatE family subunit [Micavibrio sp.]|tara:strand:+ start:1448 stop:1639 length:192 start_codon:yes stop_codon:yes gene_type:complete
MTPGIWQIAIIVVVVVLLFGGKGRVSGILSDLGKGIKSFKKGMSDDDQDTKKIDKKVDDKEEK